MNRFKPTILSGLLTMFLVVNSLAQIPNTDLVTAYLFSGNANDVSGNAYHGTVNGAILTTDRNGNSNSAYYFDGSSSITATVSPLGDAFSISMWVNFQGSDPNVYNTLLEFGDDNPWIGVNGDLELYNAGSSGVSLISYTWTHLALSYSGAEGSLKYFVNGVLVNTVSTSLNFAETALKIGNQAGADLAWVGAIDDVLIYSAPLSDLDIANIYLNDELKVYYPFTGNTFDYSSGLDATNNGATLETDRQGNVGNAYAFDGVDDYMTTTQTFASNDPFSISVWVKWNGGGGFQEILSWLDPVLSNRTYIGTDADGQIRFGDSYGNSGAYLPTNKWVHLAATYDGSNGIIYIDGQNVSSASGLNYDFANLVIGRQGNQDFEYFNGAIDDIRIFGAALDNSFITLLSQENPPILPTYYWVGDEGNWSDFSNHWATESGGTTFHTSAPTQYNDVVFDENSFATINQTVIIDIADAFCASMDWTNVTNNPTFYSPDFNNKLNVYGSIYMSENMTNNLRRIYLLSDEAEQSITTGNKTLGQFANLYFNGTGGYSFMDSVSVYGMSHGAGSLNFNGHPVNARAGFTTGGSDQKYLSLGSSKVYVRNNGWSLDGFNVNFDAGTSTIIVEEGNFDPDGSYDQGPYTYHNIELWGAVNFITGVATNNIFGGGTFNRLEVKRSGSTLVLPTSGTLDIYEFVVNSTRSAFVTIKSNSAGTAANITSPSGAVVLEYVKLQDVSASGISSFTANNSVDLGNNTNWTINAPVANSYFWVGGTGMWSDVSHWAAESGGAPFHSSAPSEFDNVYFDFNSFSSSSDQVQFEGSAIFRVANLDLSGSLEGTRIDVNAGTLYVHGNLTMGNEGTTLYAGDSGPYNAELVFAGSENHTIDTQGRQISMDVRVDGTGYYALLSDLNAYGTFTTLRLRGGALDFNGFKISANETHIYTESSLNIYLETGTLETIKLTVNDVSSSVNFFNSGSTLLFSNANENNAQVEFSSNRSLSFTNVVFQSYNTSVSVLLNSDLTVTNATLMGGTTLEIANGKTLYHSGFDVNGGAVFNTKIEAQEAGSPATLFGTLGTYNFDRVRITDISAANGTYNAYESVDAGGNTGWTFTYDETPAAFINPYPTVSDITSNTFYINFSADEMGSVTMVVLPRDAAVPTADEVLSGTGSDGVEAIFTSSLNIEEVGAVYSLEASGLMGSTDYDVYVAISDFALTPNQTISSLVQVTTEANPREMYWVGNSGNWSDFANHWATISGGTEFHDSAPTQYDNVYFDFNSFSEADHTVLLDVPGESANMDWSGIGQSVTLSAAYENPLNVYGSAIFNPLQTVSVYTLYFYGQASHSVELAGSIFQVANLYFQGDGSYTFNGDFSVNYFGVFGGSLYLGSQNVNINYDATIYGSLYLDNNQINVRDWNANLSANTLDAGTSTISVRGGFFGDNRTYNHVIKTDHGTIYGDNTYNSLRLNSGYTLTLVAGSVQTANQFYFEGSTSSQTVLQSSSNGEQAFLVQSGGGVNASYLDIKDISASGTDFYAFQSNDLGNNTGWTFTFDSQAPEINVDFLNVSGLSDSEAFVNFAVTENSTTYMVLLPSGSTAPNAQEVINFTGSGGETPEYVGSQITSEVDFGYSFYIDLLPANTAFTAYLVVVDIHSNASNVHSIGFTTMPSAREMYWVGNSGNWSDYTNHWATSSGGTTFHDSAPTQFDNVYFDENSFTEAGNIVLDDSGYCHNLDATVLSNTLIITPADVSFDFLNIYGSFYGSSNLTNNALFTKFLSDGNETISGGGGKISSYLEFDNVSGSWTISDGYNNSNGITIGAGSVTIVEDSIGINFLKFNSGDSYKSLNVANKKVYIYSLESYSTSEVDFVDEGSTIYAERIDISNAPLVLENVIIKDWFNESYLSGFFTVNNLTILPGAGISINSTSEISVESLTANGTPEAFIRLYANNPDVPAYFLKSSGEVIGQYLELTSINAGGGASFYAYDSYDLGNNIGWNFINENYITFYPLEEKTFGDAPFTISAAASSGLPVSFESSNEEVALMGWANLYETFNNCDPYQEWTTYSVTGDQSWNECNPFGNNGTNGVGINGFDVIPLPNDDWLISKPVLIEQGFELFFDIERRFEGPDLQVLVSTDYDGINNPSLFTWYDLNVAIPAPALTNDVWNEINNIDLSVFEGNYIYLAFRYTSTAEASSRYTLDNVIIGKQDPNYITIVGAGFAEIYAIQEGNDLYPQADTVKQTLIVSKAEQSINFLPLAESLKNQIPITLEASTSTNLPITYFVTDGSGEISGNQLTPTADGPITIVAYNEGDNNYNPVEAYQSSTVFTPPSYLVTFRLDLRSQESIADVVSVAGDFQIHAGFSADWNPGEVILTDADQDSIYEVTLSIYEGSYQYKFLNGNVWGQDEVVPAQCGVFAFNNGSVDVYNRYIDVFADTVLATVCFSACVSCDQIVGESCVNPMLAVQGVNTTAYAPYWFTYTAEADGILQISSLGSGIDTDLIVYQGCEGSVAAQNDDFDFENSVFESYVEFSVTQGNVYFIQWLGTVEETGFDWSLTFIEKVDQTIVFEEIFDKTFGDSEFELLASASSVLPVSFEVIEGASLVSINNNFVSILGAGFVTIRAYQNGDEAYYAANPVDVSFNINKASQSFSLEFISDKIFGDAPFQLFAQSSVSTEIYYSVVNGNISIEDDIVSINGAGTATVMAYHPGNENYLEAYSEQSFEIFKASQFVTIESITDKVITDEPFTVVAYASSGDLVSLSVVGPATIAGDVITLTGEAGVVEVTAEQIGNDNYLYAFASTSFNVIDNSKDEQTITFTGIEEKTFGDGEFEMFASASSGLQVSFEVIEGANLVSINNNLVSILGAGFVTIRAYQSGDEAYNAASPVDVSFTINKALPTITFDLIGDRAYLDADFLLNASANSGQEVVFIPLTSNISIDGTMLSILGAGEATVLAIVDENDNYLSNFAEQSFNINKAAQVITMADIPDMLTNSAAFDVEVSSSSMLVPVIEVSGPATVSGLTITLTGQSGVVTVTASEAGNENYLAAEPVTKTFNVSDPGKSDQTISFSEIATQTFGNPAFDLNVTASSGLEVSLSAIIGAELISISGKNVTVLGAGFVVIRATQDGNESFNPAISVERSFIINKADQTINFATLPSKTFGDDPIVIEASASSLLEIGFEVVEGANSLSMNGNIATITGAGNVTLRASQAGNENYNPAISVDQVMVINKADQTITFPAISDKLTTDGSFEIANASATSGLSIAFEVVSGPISISGNVVTISGNGLATVRAIQAGNENYNAANSVEQSFTITDPGKQSQTINFTSIPSKTFGDAPFTLSATSTSGLAVSLSVVSGNATISGFVITLTGEGVVVVKASQVGNSSFNPAEDVLQSFCVNPAKPVVTNSLNKTTLCDGEFTNLTAPDGYTSYLWSNGQTTQSISVSTNGSYSVTVTTADGCSSASSDAVVINTSTSKTLLATLSVDNASVCAGTTINFTLTIENEGANPTITWLVNGNSVSATGKTFSSATLSDGDLVSASVSVADVPCLINTIASSNAVDVEIFDLPTASITVSGPDLTASEGQSYKWFFEGAELGLSTQTVNVTKRGIYAVEVTNANGCTTRSANVEVSVIGIDDVTGRSLKLYPNPTFAKVTIELTEYFDRNSPIKLFDQNGKLVKEFILEFGQMTKEISLDDIRPGVYFISITSEKTLWQGRIMKQ